MQGRVNMTKKYIKSIDNYQIALFRDVLVQNIPKQPAYFFVFFEKKNNSLLKASILNS